MTLVLIILLTIPRTVEYEAGRGGMFLDANPTYSFELHKEQFLSFFASFINGDLQEIQVYENPIIKHVSDSVLKSLIIVVPAIVIGFLGGIIKGAFDFKYRKSKLNIFGKPLTWLSISLPDLFFIVMIQFFLIFLYKERILDEVHLTGDEYIQNYVYCIIFLAIYPFFYTARTTFISLESEMGFDYIRTAKAKGTRTNKIIMTHVLKNALPVILSHFDTVVLYVLSNLFIVELLTGFRGAAYFFYKSVSPPFTFTVGQQFAIDYLQALLYTIFFTLIIFIARAIAAISSASITPDGRGETV
ncbi:ABC transporter permease subunit [Bacillus litorisediminis]|uniref:ABC transporter permease subunit n=1 Tax=Bacillus litorisediminis TaxID=2922713 RepID=UPI001FAE573E|nr:ABC transporter permease subunit [Bacillus litorisediminis]